MSEQTDQIQTDVENLQTAVAAAVDHITALTNHAVAVGDNTVTDDQYANLHQALTAATDTLNDAVTKSQDAVGPIATPREP